MALAILVLAVVLGRHMGAWAAGSDASGYMNDARLLAAGNLHPRQRSIEGVPPSSLPFMGYVPLGFLPWGGEQMVPTYPMGLPVLIWATSTLGGWTLGSHLTMWIQAMAAVAAMYFLCRELRLGRESSFLGALLLGTGSLFFFASLQTMSDMPATLWSTLAILGALKSIRDPRWGLLAGFGLLLGMMIRPTNLLMVLPLACMLPWRRQCLAWFVLGALPGVAWILATNHLLYGRIFTTGYANVSRDFGVHFFRGTLTSYLTWLPVELTPLVFLAVAFPFIDSGLRPGIRLGLVLWVIPLFAFYSVYSYTHETWWYMRFVLPTYPALIAAALLVARPSLARWRLLRESGWVVAMAGILGWNIYWGGKLGALAVGDDGRVYPETCQYINAHLPNNAVILCMQESGAILYYTKNPIVRWDCIGRDDFPRILEACRHSGRRIYLVLFPFEEREALSKFAPGRWQKLDSVRSIDIWTIPKLD